MASACRELEILWLSVYRLGPEEAIEQWRGLVEKSEDADDVTTVELPLRQRLFSRCKAEVERYRRLAPAAA